MRWLAPLAALAMLATATAQEPVDARAAGADAASARPLGRLFSPSPEKQFRTALADADSPDVRRRATANGIEASAIRKEGAWAYQIEPVAVPADDLRALSAIFADERAFAPGDVTPCSSFRPDFLLTWKSRDGEWFVQVGLDCQEAEVRGPGVQFHRYIMPSSYGRLASLLERYRAMPSDDRPGR